MRQAGIREYDIARVVLTGRVPDPENLRSDGWESRANCFHLSVDVSRVEPDYDLEALAKESAADTLRSAFVRRIDALKADARDDEERRILADAVYYGLYALDGKKLEPRDAD